MFTFKRNFFEFNNAKLSKLQAKLVLNTKNNLLKYSFFQSDTFLEEKIISFIRKTKNKRDNFIFNKNNEFKKIFKQSYQEYKHCFDFSNKYFSPCKEELVRKTILLLEMTDQPFNEDDIEILSNILERAYFDKKNEYPDYQDFLKSLMMSTHPIKNRFMIDDSKVA